MNLCVRNSISPSIRVCVPAVTYLSNAAATRRFSAPVISTQRHFLARLGFFFFNVHNKNIDVLLSNIQCSLSMMMMIMVLALFVNTWPCLGFGICCAHFRCVVPLIVNSLFYASRCNAVEGMLLKGR